MEIDYDFRKSRMRIIEHTRFRLIVNQIWKTAINFLIGLVILFIFYQILYVRTSPPIYPGLIYGSPEYWAKIMALYRYENWEFLRFCWEYISGDWGRSFRVARQVLVMDLIRGKFPITLEILIYSYILTLFLLPRLKRVVQKWKYLKPILIIFSVVFVTGIVFQFFGIKLGYIPTIRITEQRDLPERITGIILIDFLIACDRTLLPGFLRYMILPVTTLTLYGLYCGLYRNKHEVTFTDQKVKLSYLTKGFMANQIPKRMNPLLFPPLFSQILCGAILTDVLFNLKGIGMLLIDALQFRDFPLIIAIIYCLFVLELMMKLGNVVFRSRSYILNLAKLNLCTPLESAIFLPTKAKKRCKIGNPFHT